MVCVRETDSYEETPVWAEVAVDDGTDIVADANKAMVVLTAAAESVKANLTVQLGLFNQRGVTAPVPVTRTFTALDLTVTRLDTGNTAFTIELTYEDGGAVVGVSVPQTVTDLPRTGVYTLSAAFAPAGDYFGLAQQRGIGSANRDSGNETQFYPVELVVDWTAPARAVDEFTFAGVTVSTTEGKAKITADVQDLSDNAIYNDIEMEYFGDVGGLRVMFSRDSNASTSGTQLFSKNNVYFNNDSLCGAGGDNWRSPTLSELGTIITPAGVTSMSLTVKGGSIPGALSASASKSEVLDLNFADADGGLHDLANSFGAEFSTEMRVISGLMGDAQGFGFIQSRGENTDASLELNHGKNMIVVCVEEIKDTYDASANPQLAGVTVSTNLSTGITAPNGTAATGKYTITAKAYYYSSIDTGSFEASAEFLDDEPLMVKFGDNPDDGPFVLKGSDGTTDVKDQTITDGVIVIDFGASKIEDGNTDLEIVLTPSLVEAVTFTVPFDAVALAANQFVFKGITISTAESKVTAEVKDNHETPSASMLNVEMEYYGEVGGLRVMFSPDVITNGTALGPRLCESGGDGGRGKTWRNPTLSELGMLLTGQSVTVLTLTVGGSFVEPSSGPANGLPSGTPGNGDTPDAVVNMTFPAAVDARGGMAAALRSDYPNNAFGSNEFSAVSGVYDNSRGAAGACCEHSHVTGDPES